MKKSVFLILIILIILVCGISGCIKKTGIPECDWQPEKSYGLCEMLCGAGVYYDNYEQKCKVLAISGCTCPNTPFKINGTIYSKLFSECSQKHTNQTNVLWNLIEGCVAEKGCAIVMEEGECDKERYIQVRNECIEDYNEQKESIENELRECINNVEESDEFLSECKVKCEITQ